ncbi:MAG: histidine phosphatase family protein [Phycisphaerales bacterium]|nr:histidine phosphatase family protein [Phycisphaerales bacterium]
MDGLWNRPSCMGKATHAAVWLVRAGATAWEREGRVAGAADLPLCPCGKDAAAQRARQLRGQVVELVLCGPDEASRATAEEVAKAVDAKVKVIDELAEVGLGLWEGVREKDLEERCPTAYRRWKEDPASVCAPEGESIDEARDRMVAALRRLIPRYARATSTMVVVLRPVALGLARCFLSGRPTSDLWELGTQGAGVERLTVDCVTLREKLGIAPMNLPTPESRAAAAR